MSTAALPKYPALQTGEKVQRSIRPFLVAALLAIPVLAERRDPRVGNTITLEATHHHRVPPHSTTQGTNDFQRVPDGAAAKVLDLEDNRHWPKIDIDADHGQGRAIEKHVASMTSSTAPLSV